MLPFTATGWVRTPVNRSPGRAVSLESFSLMRTLMGVPAGIPGKGDACASDAQTIIAYRANRTFPVRLLIDLAFLPGAVIIWGAGPALAMSLQNVTCNAFTNNGGQRLKVHVLPIRQPPCCLLGRRQAAIFG